MSREEEKNGGFSDENIVAILSKNSSGANIADAIKALVAGKDELLALICEGKFTAQNISAILSSSDSSVDPNIPSSTLAGAETPTSEEEDLYS